MTYTIHFNRAAGTAFHPCVMGLGWDYACTGSDAYLDVCRAMTDADELDGSATFVDERGVACATVRSIHACARRYRPAKARRETANVET